MSTGSATAFIARMKVRELQRLRDDLAEQYDAILAAASERTGTERVALLREKLATIAVAGEKVHPSLPDLRAALRAGLDDAEAQKWEARLLREIERGRARSEAAFVFGRLLEETAIAPAASTEEEALLDGAFARATATDGARAPTSEATALLDELFAEGGAFARAQVRAAFAAPDDETAPPDLSAIAADPELTDDVRAEARTLAKDEGATLALFDGLKLLETELPAWRYPAAVPLRSITTAHRARVHPRLDLVTILLFDAIATRLSSGYHKAFRSGHANRRARHDRLVSLNAPAIILENERAMLAAPLGALNDPAILDPETHAESSFAVRERQLVEVGGSFERGGGYEYGAGRALPRLLAAEIAARRAGCPEDPIFVLKTDVADCFASIDHEVVLGILERAGVPEDLRAFVRTYLRVPLTYRGVTKTATRGLILGQPLSRVLANMLLSLVELAIRRRCPDVVILRSVDDFVLVAKRGEEIAAALPLLRGALASFGLRLNEEKTGAVAIGAALPGDLPKRVPAFGPLVLTAEGFQVDGSALRAYLADARKAVRGRASLLDAVRDYNRDLRFLCEATLSDVEIADGHRARAKRALFAALAEDGGIEGWLREEIDRRSPLRHRLPEGWLYWPVTAGGLGLVDVRLEIGARAETKFEPPKEPFDEKKSAAWGMWYASLLETPKSDEPAEDPAMSALTKDFIARSGEISGEAKSEIAPYWRWVLATHGPDILEAFGTYRFLIKRLVPLELIRGGLEGALEEGA